MTEVISQQGPPSVVDSPLVALKETDKRERVLVTHKSPDLDALVSTWLMKRLLPGWQDVPIAFVNAGERSLGEGESKKVDKPGDVDKVIETISGVDRIYLDTGLSPFDHHQPNLQDPQRMLSATSLAWEYVQQHVTDKIPTEKRDLIESLVSYTLDEDNFQHLYWETLKPEDHFFTLYQILYGVQRMFLNDDQGFTEFSMRLLDGLVEGTHTTISTDIATVFKNWSSHSTYSSLIMKKMASYFIARPTADRFSLKNIIHGLHALLGDTQEFTQSVTTLLDGVATMWQEEILPAQEAFDRRKDFVTSSGKEGTIIKDSSLFAERLAFLKGKKVVLQLSPSSRGTGHVHARIGLIPPKRGEEEAGFTLESVQRKILQGDPAMQGVIPNDTSVWFFHPNGKLATNSDIHKVRTATGYTEDQLQQILIDNL